MTSRMDIIHTSYRPTKCKTATTQRQITISEQFHSTQQVRKD